MALPVAVQLYSVREEAANDFKGVLQQVKAMGYDGVEFAGIYDWTPEQVKEMVTEIGLIPVSVHVGIDLLLANPEKVISDYALIGCRYIAIPWLEEARRPGHKNFEKTIEEIALLGKICKSFGITLLYHNHDFEFQKNDQGEYALDVLYATIPSDILQTEIDTCWVNVGGENPADYVKKYKGRAPVVHLKDFVMNGREKPDHLYELVDDGKNSTKESTTAEEGNFAFRPIGYGVQDIPSILAAAEYAGAKWVVVEQDSAVLNTPMESIQMSRNYLKKQGW